VSGALEDYVHGLRNVQLASMALLTGELTLDREDVSVTAVKAAEDQLALKARDLVRAVDALPMERKPKGWAE
jgi:hypothetical protein